MQHNKSVLFLISLSQNKIREIEDKGVDYRMFLKTIRSYSHVEVHETINEELLSKAPLYEVVIIIGHQVDGCIEMADSSLFPMNKVASAFNPTFNGYIHVAICGSSIIRDNIKACCPNSRVRTSKKTTQLELQLLIYSLLLSRTDLNRETFDYWYEFERNYIKDIQERKDPSDLIKLPCATKLGESTVYIPKTLKRDKKYPFHIFIHENDIEEEKEKREKIVINTPAKPVDLERDVKEISIWISDLVLNDNLTINLSFDTDLVTVEDSNPPFIWKKHQIHAVFLVTLNSEFIGNNLWCTINVDINGNSVKSFKIEIAVDHFELPDYQRTPYTNFNFHQHWMTRKAERVFSRAIDNQWIKETENGFKWVGFGKNKENGQVISRTRKLAYLCHEIFGDEVPWEDIETFFGERKLSRDWGNVHNGNSQSWWVIIQNFINMVDHENSK